MAEVGPAPAAGSKAAGAAMTTLRPPTPLIDKPAPNSSTTTADPWFMLAALLTVAAAADDQEQRHLVQHRAAPAVYHHHQQLWTTPGTVAGGAGGSPHSKKTASTSTATNGGLYACNQRYRRQISSATDMRFLHIPREMAEALIPDIMAYQIERPGRKKMPVRVNHGGRPVFASRVTLIDQDGRTWPVLFRTYVTGKQFHRRLTDGWRPFSSHHALTAGDAVHFWRQAEDESADALVMRVQVVRGMLR